MRVITPKFVNKRFCIFQIDPDGIPLPSLLFVVESHKRFTRCKVSGAVSYIRGPYMKATRKRTRSPEFNGFLFQTGQSNHTVCFKGSFTIFDDSGLMATGILKPLSENSIHKVLDQGAFF